MKIKVFIDGIPYGKKCKSCPYYCNYCHLFIAEIIDGMKCDKCLRAEKAH